jgi:hypothetical protein
MPDDLQAALGAPSSYGQKMFGRGEMASITPDFKPVKDPGGLITLRAQTIASLGPGFLWIIMLSPVELASLTDEEKEMHATMRMSWVSAHDKGSELILQYWFWKLLQDKTELFGPLLKVFSSNLGTASACGTAAWTQIFTLYPLAGNTITHKLLACGLEKCLTFKDDSTAAFTAYIAVVNESSSQLSNMPPMSITDIYALVTLMGLHLSSSDHHEKAYHELIAYVDEGNSLALEKVQQVRLKYASSRHPVACTFALTREHRHSTEKQQPSTQEALQRDGSVYAPKQRDLERVCCLLVLDSVTSTPQWIRQPKPRGHKQGRAKEKKKTIIQGRCSCRS